MNLHRRTTPRVLALTVALASLGAGCEHRDAPAVAAIPGASGHELRVPAVRQERHTASGDARLDLEFTVDRIDMTVAERVYATLTATTRPQATVTMPTLGQSLSKGNSADVPTLGSFTVVSSDTSETVVGPLRHTTLRLVLEPFLAGEKELPSLTVAATDAGKGFSLRTEAVKIRVRPVAEETANAQTPLEPARGPVALPAPAIGYTVGRVFLVAAAPGAVVLAIIGVLVARSRRNRSVDPVVRVRGEFKRLRAMLAGDSTRAGALAALGDLHAALARYLRDAAEIPADTHTGADLHAAIKHAERLTPEQRAELQRVLDDMERSRFAPEVASATGAERLLSRCAAWVDDVHARAPQTAGGAV